MLHQTVETDCALALVNDSSNKSSAREADGKTVREKLTSAQEVVKSTSLNVGAWFKARAAGVKKGVVRQYDRQKALIELADARIEVNKS